MNESEADAMMNVVGRLFVSQSGTGSVHLFSLPVPGEATIAVADNKYGLHFPCQPKIFLLPPITSNLSIKYR
jgi:hypothetical protein